MGAIHTVTDHSHIRMHDQFDLEDLEHPLRSTVLHHAANLFQDEDWAIHHSFSFRIRNNSSTQTSQSSRTEQTSRRSVHSLRQSFSEQLFPSSSSRRQIQEMPPLFSTSDYGMQSILNLFSSSRSRRQSSIRSNFTNRERPKILGILNNKKKKKGLGTRLKHVVTENVHESAVQLSDTLQEELTCPICLDIFDHPISTPCLHIFCAECIVASLLQQSLCPLCRAAVYSQNLHVVDLSSQHDKLRDLHNKYSRLIVQCALCRWIGSMGSWDQHYRSPDCKIRQRNGQDLVPSSSTQINSYKPFSKRHHDKTVRFYRSQTRYSPHLVHASKLNPAESLPSSSSSSSSLPIASPIDELICWILDQRFNKMIKLYVVYHHIEELIGALAGGLSQAIHHAQAIIEVAKSDDNEDDDNDDGNVSQNLNDVEHIFISMELFRDQDYGLSWQVFDQFPNTRSTAHQIVTYPIDPASRQISILIEFLTRCRHRKYDLLGWNCQTFILEFKKAAKITNTPARTYVIPKPESYSKTLVDFLQYIQEYRSLPVLIPLTVSEHANTNWASRWLKLPKLNCQFSATHRPTQIIPSTPQIFVRDVYLCLFPAEDRYRASIWPAATISNFWKQALPLIRPHRISSNENPVRENNPVRYPMTPHSNIGHIKLRYQTLPVLLFHVRAREHHDNSDTWTTLCYLSVEFRSDHGLWWHVYRELPPGLSVPASSGGTDYVLSSQTEFTLDSLMNALNSLQNKRYHSNTWSGWEFTEFIIHQCCPSAAHHLLNPNISEPQFN